MEFTGFRDETFAFFRELSANNSEEWFEANQSRFEECVLVPMRALVLDLRGDLEKLHPNLVQDDLDAHFSQMRRGPQSRPGVPPIKTSFYSFFWDSSVRRLNDGWFFVGVGADGVTIGMSIYDFGDPEARMQRIFKPRLRRYLTYLDDYIKANYLRRGFDFHRYVRAAGKLGIREVDAFPTAAAEWDGTLGWVVKRHLHTESSRLTPGSFLTEVRESFERLYPLYSFAADPREEFLRLLRVPARARALQANGPMTTVARPAVVAAEPETADRASEDTVAGTSDPATAPAKSAASQKRIAKKPAKKKAAAKKKATAKKVTAKPKKVAAKQAPKPKKKNAAKKKPTTKKKAVAKRSSSKKAAPKKKAVTKKKAATKKKSATKAVARKPAKRVAKKANTTARKRVSSGARASARSR